jgi:predicted HicB family RNase H-like nuclease
VIEYKGYIGTIEIDQDERNLFGKVVNISGDVFYEGDTIDALEQSMHDALDGYLAMCVEEGITPDRPYNGSLRVRVEPRTHAKIAAEAESKGVPMNRLIAEALAARFDGRRLDQSA